MIDLEKISKEHEKLFPVCTLESQVLKMEEECKELYMVQNTDNAVKELADCIIVCAGIYRFTPNFARTVANEIINANIDIVEELEKEVNRKWQINLKRKWEFKNGVYKHIGKDGNE